jgi:hypothetical protein
VSKGFTKGDPRAVAAGRKGGSTPRLAKRSPVYKAGYQSGWAACDRKWKKALADDLARAAEGR